MGDRKRRPSVAVDLASFENEAAGAGPIDAEKAAFEVDSAPGRGVSPARKPQETGGLGFSIVPGRGGSGKKGAVPATSREDSDWKSMQDSDSVYASSNQINEDEMEDKLDAEARAAGFEFVPENWQQRVFIMLDEPASGLVASLIGYAIMLLIIASSVCLVAETYPPLGPCSLPDMAEVWGFDSPEEACESYGTTVEEAQSLYDMFHAVEAFIIIVFTVEYGLRIALCTNRPRRNRSFVHYCTRSLNMIDLISIIPWWVELAFKTPASGAGVVRMLRLARVFRLLKAGSFLKELQLFGWGYYRAREGLLLLWFMLFMYLCCFGAVLYLLEYKSQTEACFGEAGYPMCWQDLGVDEVAQFTDGGGVAVQPDDGISGPVVAWDMVVERQESCYHCLGNAWYSCIGVLANGTETTYGSDGYVETESGCSTRVPELSEGAAAWSNRTTEVPCTPQSEHPGWVKMTADDDLGFCMKCSDVQWPGKEPMRCAVRGFTSIPTTTYLIMATMTTVGYGEHYPGYWPGQIACAFCMMSGIFVLALPMNVIGVAFEETIREENRFKAERERRLKLMLLKRKTQTGESYDASEQALADRLQLDIDRLNREKAKREQYDEEHAREHVIALLQRIYNSTNDERFHSALDIMLKDKDAV